MISPWLFYNCPSATTVLPASLLSICPFSIMSSLALSSQYLYHHSIILIIFITILRLRLFVERGVVHLRFKVDRTFERLQHWLARGSLLPRVPLPSASTCDDALGCSCLLLYACLTTLLFRVPGNFQYFITLLRTRRCLFALRAVLG